MGVPDRDIDPTVEPFQQMTVLTVGDLLSCLPEDGAPISGATYGRRVEALTLKRINELAIEKIRAKATGRVKPGVRADSKGTAAPQEDKEKGKSKASPSTPTLNPVAKATPVLTVIPKTPSAQSAR